MTIISVVAAWAVCAAGVQAQAFLTIPQPANGSVTPKFVPAGQRPASGVVPAGFTQPLPVQKPNKNGPDMQPRRPAPADDIADLNLRTELPGRERLFVRESEANFYERIRQDAKRHPGANPAILPTDEPIISKETYVTPNYPRVDARTKQPFASRAMTVEPCYVIHRRLLFEQPNFERAGYDFGVAQPFIHLGVFYYDLALAPYHFWTDPNDRFESSLGKCLPGDPAPFLIPCEKLSVTGLLGQAGTIVGLSYLFP